MASIGKIGEFDYAVEDWPTYVERLELFCAANDIKDDRKKACLLTQMGAKTYRLLQNLVLPAKPVDKSYADIVKILSDHLVPTRLTISERYRFYKRNQKPEETITEYVAELRKLTKYCKFEKFLDEMLRDRFVCGVHSETIQELLLTKEDKMTFTEAVAIALSKETAMKDSLELHETNKKSAEITVQAIASREKPRKRERRKQTRTPCISCGKRNHKSDDCFYKDATCYRCGEKGHVTTVCSSDKPRSYGKRQNVQDIHQDDTSEEDTDEEEVAHLGVHRIGTDVIWMDVTIDGVSVKMELDTGSAVTVMNKEDFSKYFPDKALKATKLRLRTYTGEKIKPLGVASVTVEVHEQKQTLELVVIKTGGAPLFGRDWLNVLKLNWKDIAHMSPDRRQVSPKPDVISSLLTKYQQVFLPGIGKLKGIKAKLSVYPDVSPKYCKPRQVPYALRPKVEAEIDRLEKEGILSKVNYSEWATPVVPVPKQSGAVRLCGDFKITVNPALKIDDYPLPLIEDIFASLAGGTHFTVIDLAQAYHQMEIEEDSRKYVTLNTQKGLYRYNRLVFGIKSAPSIWQKAMDQVLQGISGVHCYLDDILVTGKTTEEHLRNLEEVLVRLHDYGLRANKDKCKWFETSVTYLGHIVSKEGLHKEPSKVKAVSEAPTPHDVTSLRSFLGLVNYYHKFIPNLSSVLHPLYQLLEKDRKWQWTSTCEEAFQTCKRLLTSNQVLTHYNPNLPVRLACDASQFGIGAVLSHVMPNRTERPIAFASRSLNNAEKAYAQIDKEALSLVWGVKHFNHYLYGRHFQLVTDHKPLTYIFHPDKGIPVTAAARMQRWALFLSGHDYDIVYKNTKQHGNADGLSRLPVNQKRETTSKDACEIFNLEQAEMLPITVKEIENETRRDPILSKVYEFTRHGWPNNVPHCLKEFEGKIHELSIHGYCVMWGIRVIVPRKYQQTVLKELHQGHLGVVKMKSLARSYIWWPGIDKEIEDTVKSCAGCQEIQKSPSLAPLHPWEWPATPWERIHIDFAGPFINHMFLVIVDAHTKWPEIFKMKNTSSSDTIAILRTLFARTGIPFQLVSDNGPQFVSEEFRSFMKSNGIQHIRSAPYHPATNGLAERMVQTFKNSMKASKANALTVQKQLDKFLMAYRNAPHATTNRSPAQMFYGRSLTSRLDLLKPDVRRKVIRTQTEQGKYQGKRRIREFQVGDSVLVRDYRGAHKWQRGEVAARHGIHYDVKVAPGTYWRRHVEQIISTSSADNMNDELQTYPSVNNGVDREETLMMPPTHIERTVPEVISSDVTIHPEIVTPTQNDAMTNPDIPSSQLNTASHDGTTDRRYPLRVRKQTQRFQAS